MAIAANTMYICWHTNLTRHMNNIVTDLNNLFDRIPRRHTVDNYKEINTILIDFETVLTTIEAINISYEKKMPTFFNTLDETKNIVKKSNDNKASKKVKDTYFDEAADLLKDTIQQVILVYDNGNAFD